jgi:6-phosphogluconate dehydrogenase
MVHNGIEYAMMQLISEVYGILKTAGLSNEELKDLFTEWDRSGLQSFLIEITARVLDKKESPGNLLVDMILDKAKQKGTGMWTSQSAMDLNVPVPTIDAAVSMRYMSSMKEERVLTAESYGNEKKHIRADKKDIITLCKNSLHFSFLLSYAQGLQLLRVASVNYKYGVDISEVLRIWKGGCIIRSALLNDLWKAYHDDPSLTNIIHSPRIRPFLASMRDDIASLTRIAIDSRIPVAALSASLNYFDAYCSAQLPANLIQAQRDYFGAHTYERVDKPGTFHTEWN